MNFKGLFAKSARDADKHAVQAGDIYELVDNRHNLFQESLDDLTPDDLAPLKPREKRSASDIAYSMIRYIVMAISLCVFIGSALTLVRSFVDYQRGDDLYEDLSANIFESSLGGERAVATSRASKQSPAMLDYYASLSEDAVDITDSSESSYNIKFEQMKVNLTHLRTINPDIYGYIHIDGTNISYPIVQYTDNDYYLDHSYTNEYMVVGSIFADFRASSNIENDRNTVFYGHNIKTGSMFNNVMNFYDEEVFNNKLIEIYTFDGIYYFKPFAIYDTISTYQYFRMSFDSDEDFLSFCEEMKSNSKIANDTTFTADDQIITLSTCTNDWTGTGRYALHAKLVKVER